MKIGGSVVEAVVDLAVPSAKAKAGAAAVQIEAFEAEPDSRYRAVLVPQQTTLDVEVELQDGSVCRKSAVSYTHLDVYKRQTIARPEKK